MEGRFIIEKSRKKTAVYKSILSVSTDGIHVDKFNVALATSFLQLPWLSSYMSITERGVLLVTRWLTESSEYQR